MANPIIRSFAEGILYFFGLSENPVEKRYRQQHKTEMSGAEIDACNLASDWRRVGNDIRSAYEQETASTR
jgi:hypothetical protein